MKRFVSKIAQSGFYIILFLCMTAIGISGYVMYLAKDTADTVGETIDIGSSIELPFPEREEETLYDFGAEIPVPAMKEEMGGKEQVPEVEPEKTPVIEEKVKPVPPENAKEKETAYTMAVSGAVTEPFSGTELVKSESMGDWRIHSGVDIKGEPGTDVKAIADGTVTSVEADSMMGNTVKIEHPDGIVSIYANLEDGIKLKKGDAVKGGDTVGKIGQSALAECLDAPHVHLEVIKNGEYIDPLSLYPSGEE